ADGLTWTTVTAGTTDRLEGVLWTGSQYVAISQLGTLFTSTDGITWSSTSSNLASWMEGVAWSPAKYVVVGAAGEAATSNDGSTWTSLATGTAATLHGIVWSGGAPTPTGSPGVLLASLGQTPVISANPASAIVTAGNTATLSVTATGTGLSYQWYKNGVAITGATSASLSIATAQGRDSGQYTVVVQGLNGSATSATAYLTVPPVYTFSTLAGLAGVLGYADGIGGLARFEDPRAVVSDGNGSVYVVDTNNCTIRKVTSTGNVSTIAGSPRLSGTADGTGAAARFYSPGGIARDSGGILYVSDSFNSTIRQVTPTGVVTTFAGQPRVSGSNDGSALVAQFATPQGLVFDSHSNLYVTDINQTIRRISSSGIVSTIAGQAGLAGYTDGSSNSARFSGPVDIAADANGNLFVADFYNLCVRKISSSGIVTTFAQVNGSPTCVTCDTSGNLFVSGADDTVRLITPSGLSVVIGGLSGASGGADGVGTVARFNLPWGVDVEASGKLYIADTFNHTIRVGTPSFVMPSIATQPVGQAIAISAALTLSVTTAGTGPFTYQWLKDGTAIS
ncbi:MAG TPA: immunoglobulin domain-containing protein, partial [Candidatus Saccharimonadales bacterium]|nr:immunoglobulin domain-containing protein [Candidatus Saccharimonadales bacterium]